MIKQIEFDPDNTIDELPFRVTKLLHIIDKHPTQTFRYARDIIVYRVYRGKYFIVFEHNFHNRKPYYTKVGPDDITNYIKNSLKDLDIPLLTYYDIKKKDFVLTFKDIVRYNFTYLNVLSNNRFQHGKLKDLHIEYRARFMKPLFKKTWLMTFCNDDLTLKEEYADHAYLLISHKNTCDLELKSNVHVGEHVQSIMERLCDKYAEHCFNKIIK